MWKSKQFLWVRSFCTALTLCVLSRVGTAEENDLKTAGASKPDFSCIDADRFYDHYVWTKQEQKHYLFCPLSKELLQLIPSASGFTVDRCNVAPTFLSPSGNQTYFLPVGSWMVLNCTVKLLYDQKFNWCDPNIEWSKDGHVIMNSSKYTSTEETRFNHNASEKFISSLLNISMMDESDYGIFACFIRKGSTTFTLQRDYNASHVPAVLGALLVLFALLLAGLLYVKCRLDLQLWYRNKYGEFEMNEPSAELIMNISRCRRLIVVLSKSYLEQDWCRLNFREALWQLLDLSRRPIFIMFESQYRELSHPAIQLLKSQRKSFTLLLWTSTSMTPSSEFWKQLRLLLPRKISHRSVMADPQTRLQDDKDPMLILNPDYLDCRSDPDPEGDLGVRAPIYKGPPPPVFALPKMKTNSSVEPPSEYTERSDVDIADLGSRNYETRTDFYCLVTEDDI
ncbi:hypothetical protein chiPu_0012743 [Chiloscyllium punctatum]|uniref:Ig-like domain-containing protein n=1 Tax=Chiloscyllium punctatum TaxID=137246 RepID=A0A401SV58_CHIPU|nr:hypothetical protein [Chiloscyllium punctatum]